MSKKEGEGGGRFLSSHLQSKHASGLEELKTEMGIYYYLWIMSNNWMWVCVTKLACSVVSTCSRRTFQCGYNQVQSCSKFSCSKQMDSFELVWFLLYDFCFFLSFPPTLTFYFIIFLNTFKSYNNTSCGLFIFDIHIGARNKMYWWSVSYIYIYNK